MSLPPVPAAARIQAITGRMAAFAPPPGFDEALADAAERAAPPPPAPGPAEQPGHTVVGILGIPVHVAAGTTFAATAPRAYPVPPLPAQVAGWAEALPERGRRWAGMIEQAAAAADLDPRVLAAVAWAESGFKPDAVSHAGAMGLVQLMPGTAAGLGVDPWDPQQNLDGGARYLATQLARFGRLDHALAAYNAGPGRVQRAGGVPNIAETQAYVPKVLDYLARLGGAA